MTTLGQAYVQIMPSAKGISGSIQKTLDPEALSAGKSAGSRIASSIADSMGKAGSTLTKAITLPALGAATAITGLVGALGFKRLVGMDVAQAKLKGLGFEGKQLEIVMENARDAVTGTTHTMADGANVAAGALAAGVKEGADLERFIKLVGDAATGANAPMGEMAQIFNRVQGTGKLTRHELNQIEHRLPGFSQAMAKHVGADSLDAFYDMVSAGKIGSDEFLDVMDDFAGGMSAAYAETWSGLKDNVLANIGIIGEALMEGLFEDGKKGMAEFLDFLRNSDGLKEWARDTGETLRNVFSTIVETIKNVINWWTNLDGSTQKMIITLTGIAIAIGPVLMVISRLITTVMTVSRWFGMLKVAAGAIGTAIGAISTPVLIVIGVIAGLIALFTTLYHKNEGFRDLVLTVWETIKETISTVIQTISDFVMEIFGGLVEWWNKNNELIRESIQVVWGAIQSIIMGALGIIVPIIKTAFQSVKNIIVAVWNVIKAVITTVINLIKGIIKAGMQIITGDWRGAWQTIQSTVSGLLNGIKNIISSLLNAAVAIIRGILNNIRSVFSSIFNGLRSIVSSAFNAVRGAVSSGMSSAFNAVTGFLGRFKDAGRRIVTSIADGIKGAIGAVTGAIGNVASKIRNFLPFSPPKEGPLMDIMDVQWGETIGAGIEKGESAVAKAMEDILAFDLTKKATFGGLSKDEMLNHYNAQQQSQPIILQLDGVTLAQVLGDYTSAEGGKRIRRIERGLAT